MPCCLKVVGDKRIDDSKKPWVGNSQTIPCGKIYRASAIITEPTDSFWAGYRSRNLKGIANFQVSLLSHTGKQGQDQGMEFKKGRQVQEKQWDGRDVS